MGRADRNGLVPNCENIRMCRGLTPPSRVWRSARTARESSPVVKTTRRKCGTRTGAVLFELKGHTTPVLGVAFSPDGTRIITGGDPQYGTPQGDPSRMRISPVEGPGEVKVWDARTEQAQFDLKGHTTSVTSVAFSPDGTRIVTSGGIFDAPYEVKVWDAAKGGKALLELNGIDRSWCNVSFSPDGKWIVAGDAEGSTTILNVSTGAVESQFEVPHKKNQLTAFDPHIGKGVLSASFSPDGTRILTGVGMGNDAAGEAIVWDAEERNSSRSRGTQAR